MSKLTQVLKDRFENAKTYINSQCSIESYMRERGFNIQSNRQIKCPFHEDSTPSFSVDTERNIWKCFGCPDGGHFLDLWIKYNNRYEGTNYNVYSAIEKLIQDNPDIQASLGFNTIFYTEDVTESIFSREAKMTTYFNKIPTKIAPIQKVSTDGMHKVLKKLEVSDNSVLLQFIADCESGYSDEQLFSKYYKQQETLDDFILSLSKKNEDDEDIEAAFKEALL